MVDYPVSANRYWRNFNGRMVVSAEASQYKQHVALLWASQSQPFHVGPVEVSILLHPKLTTKGEASRTRIDLDNCIKVAIDALNGVAFADDKQVRKLVAEIAEPVEGGALSVRVSA
jgi:crossover junction endodeoxyribonuclease RusA